MFEGVKNYIYNIWHYRKLLYNDYNFDWVYLIKFINTKLKRMYKYYNKNILYFDKKYLEQINNCIIILNRIEEDNYDIKYMDYLNYKYGKYKNTITKGGLIDFGRTGVNESNQEEYDKAFSEAFYNSEKELESDIKQVFEIISKNIRNWWL